MNGYCDNFHPLWVEKEGKGEGCLSWECPEHVRHSWTGERPASPETYSARVEAPAIPGICCTEQTPCKDHRKVRCSCCGGAAYAFQVDAEGRGACDECALLWEEED